MTLLGRIDEIVTSLGAEMGHIDARGGIVRLHAQKRAFGKRGQTLARLENRNRAIMAAHVKTMDRCVRVA